MAKAGKGRERRTLAKPLTQGGTLRQPGETVELRPDQIARLEAQGYLTARKAPDGPTGTRASAEGAGETDGKETAT